MFFRVSYTVILNDLLIGRVSMYGKNHDLLLLVLCTTKNYFVKVC